MVFAIVSDLKGGAALADALEDQLLGELHNLLLGVYPYVARRS